MYGSTDSEVRVLVPPEITYLSNFVPCTRGRAYKHGLATKCEGNNWACNKIGFGVKVERLPQGRTCRHTSVQKQKDGNHGFTKDECVNAGRQLGLGPRLVSASPEKPCPTTPELIRTKTKQMSDGRGSSHHQMYWDGHWCKMSSQIWPRKVVVKFLWWGAEWKENDNKTSGM